MKFDKDIIIAIAICAVVLFGWQPLSNYMGWTPAPTPATSQTPSATSAPTPAAVQPSTAATVPQTTAATAPAAPVAAPAVTLANQDTELKLSPSTGAISRIILKDYQNAKKSGNVEIDQRLSATAGRQPLTDGALSVFSGKEKWRTTGVAGQWLKANTEYRLVRKMATPAGRAFVITAIWSLNGKYATDCAITFQNPAKEALTLPNVVVSGGELELWTRYSGDKMRSDSVKLDYCTEQGTINDLSGDGKETKFFADRPEPMRWTALSNKYFISILKGETPFKLYRTRTTRTDKPEEYIVNTGAEYPSLTIPANGAVTLRFNYYAGPKVASELATFSPEASRSMHLAWGPLDYLARLMLWALDGLKSWCGSYGWSIIILTVIVRLLFWPITAKANASMKRMSAVQPKIQALREQYKSNPQMLNTKMMELYREEKINPMGGCLPILLQIPVFFALYATLDGAVALRQVSFWWAHDLAAADTVGYLFGLPLNPLVIAMTVLMLVQQMLTPSAMDPMQKKMMLAMPVVMLFFLYDLPSGLTLYWTVSQIFSIIQLLIQQRSNRNTVTPATAGKRA